MNDSSSVCYTYIWYVFNPLQHVIIYSANFCFFMVRVPKYNSLLEHKEYRSADGAQKAGSLSIVLLPTEQESMK